jgi:hypothetical protein
MNRRDRFPFIITRTRLTLDTQEKKRVCNDDVREMLMLRKSQFLSDDLTQEYRYFPLESDDCWMSCNIRYGNISIVVRVVKFKWRKWNEITEFMLAQMTNWGLFLAWKMENVKFDGLFLAPFSAELRRADTLAVCIWPHLIKPDRFFLPTLLLNSQNEDIPWMEEFEPPSLLS